MSLLSAIVATLTANARRRKPSIVLYIQDQDTGVQVQFDRTMDELQDTCLFRTCDETYGVLEWSDATWVDERRLNLSSSTVIDPVFVGARRVIYMSGDIRAQGRYRLPVRERCDRVEDA